MGPINQIVINTVFNFHTEKTYNAVVTQGRPAPFHSAALVDKATS